MGKNLKTSFKEFDNKFGKTSNNNYKKSLATNINTIIENLKPPERISIDFSKYKQHLPYLNEHCEKAQKSLKDEIEDALELICPKQKLTTN